MDNPWFPPVLEDERLHCKLTNKEDYEQIWEGKCRKSVAGAIYAGEIAQCHQDDRITRVPYDPRFKVHSIWDLGFNDAMAVIMVQRVRSELRIIGYYEENHKTIDEVAAFLNTNYLYNWGDDWLPHDGYAKECRAGKSAYEILKRSKRKPRRENNSVPRETVENGIKAARTALRQSVFDSHHTKRLLECLKRYRRSINQQTNTPGAPLHDEFSNGADAFRYLGLVADRLQNEDTVQDFGPIHDFVPLDSEMGY
jgi:phage terminase large subunit